jgi:hypothetical protein
LAAFVAKRALSSGTTSWGPACSVISRSTPVVVISKSPGSPVR